MRITFASSYLSIHSFPEIDIPDFCLLTGLNGAGKSHFLQALQAGNLRADVAPTQTSQSQTEIRLFDWNSLVPQDTGIFMSEQLRNERVDAFNQFNGLRTLNGHMENLRNIVRQFQLPEEYLRDPAATASLSVLDLAPICGQHDPQNVYNHLQQVLTQAETHILNNIGEPVRSRVRTVAAASAKPLLRLIQSDFFLTTTVSSWGEVNIFQQSFARLFVAYRDAYLANQLGQYLASKGETDVTFVSDEEFLRTNGPAPWKFVNDSLAAAGLDFKINQPALNENTPFQPELTKRSTGATIPFGALSSGEKVLMSFAFCVYYSNDRRQLALHPKVILLDEVDAPLHPSMSKNLIQTIRETLVGSYNIKVILTTHSPSTVAIAPEESVYVMTPGVPGLHKSSRAEALNLLTVGVPTLSISYEGRRQVFVESPADAKTYDGVYKLLKPRIASERSLEFVATGTRSQAGADRNTGCDLVKKIVSDLGVAGNQSVFGLIDWDGHHESTARIAVLAKGTRNGLENVVFDPLAIALLICRDFSAQKHAIGIAPETSFISFAQLDLATMQNATNRVTESVLGEVAQITSRVEYTGGMILDVDTKYLTIDDHELETRLLATFPFLQGIARQQAGRLAQHIIATVFTDVPNAIPQDLRAVLADLLERPSH